MVARQYTSNALANWLALSLATTLTLSVVLTGGCGAEEPQAPATTDDAQSGSGGAGSGDGQAAEDEPDASPSDAWAYTPRPKLSQPPLQLQNVTLLVTMGDSITAGDGVELSESYRRLLMMDDGNAHPGWPDASSSQLQTRFPGIKAQDVSVSGASSSHLATTQLPEVNANRGGGHTLVVVTTGGNDLMDNISVALDQDEVQKVVAKVIANIEAVRARFADATNYPGGATLVITNVYDFTSGHGSIPKDADVAPTCRLIGGLAPEVGQKLIDNLTLINAAYDEYVSTHDDVWLLDINAHFRGHGYNHALDTLPAYDKDDPTLWFQRDCIHPNARGHHEIRRLFWQLQ